jgi:hypothetical protein
MGLDGDLHSEEFLGLVCMDFYIEKDLHIIGVKRASINTP